MPSYDPVMASLRSALQVTIVLWLAAMLSGCSSSSSGADEPVSDCERQLVAEFSLVRDVAGDVFTTGTGNLDIEVVWRDENAGAVLGTVDRPVFIIDASAEPDFSTDDNGFKTINDQRFRDDSITVTPGSYRIYSPSNVDVTVFENCG